MSTILVLTNTAGIPISTMFGCFFKESTKINPYIDEKAFLQEIADNHLDKLFGYIMEGAELSYKIKLYDSHWELIAKYGDDIRRFEVLILTNLLDT